MVKTLKTVLKNICEVYQSVESTRQISQAEPLNFRLLVDG